MINESILNLFGIKTSDLLWVNQANLFEVGSNKAFGAITLKNGKIIASFGGDVDTSKGYKHYVTNE